MGGKNNKEKKKDEEESKTKKLDFIEYYKNNFFRDIKTDFFQEFSSNNKENFNMEIIWKLKLDKDRLNNKNKNINEKVIKINKMIYNDYEKILKKYNYNSENKEEFGENIKQIFLILCNIYDLIPNCLETYFQGHWIEMHLKLFNICVDFNNISKEHKSDDKNQIYLLQYFLTLFCICISKDEDYSQSIYILTKYPDFFYKVLVIAICLNYVCCCGNALSYCNNLISSCFKTGQLIFEVFKSIEEKKISLNIKDTKMKCVVFMVKNLGKNISSIYLLKMGEVCNNNDDIFNYLINETNLLEETLTREAGDFGHCIEQLEEFCSICKNPYLLFKILNSISPPKTRVKMRVYREILKTLNNIINDNNIKMFEKYLYNGIIFEKIIETLKYNIWLGEYEGIWELLLNSDNQYIIKIFHRNKYHVKKILEEQVDNLIYKGFIGNRLIAVKTIMNLFTKMGEKVKIQFGGYNFYANEFKDIYKTISYYIK